jgi:methionyl-tRNA formyltransferase
MRIVLVGAVESTRVALEALAGAGAPPVALATLPPARAARHADYVDLAPLAASLGVPVVDAVRINDPEVVARLRDFAPDHLMVVGWSQICGDEVRALAPGGAIGYHPSLLPRDRGRGVLPWTILLEREETASTFFWMDEGMDSGDLLAQERFAVAPDETAASLYAKHMAALRALVAATVPLLRGGAPPRTPQDHARATWCARRTPEDGLIDWTLPARRVWALVRASGDPYAGAFTFLGGERVVVVSASLEGPGPYAGFPGQVQALRDDGALVQCGDGAHVLLRTLRREDGTEVPARALLTNHARLGIDWLRLHEHVRGRMG